MLFSTILTRMKRLLSSKYEYSIITLLSAFSGFLLGRDVAFPADLPLCVIICKKTIAADITGLQIEKYTKYKCT